jgi:hypothetical protein
MMSPKSKWGVDFQLANEATSPFLQILQKRIELLDKTCATKT